MAWKIEITDHATEIINRLDPQVKRRIFRAIDKISQLDDPRQQGKPLSGNLGGLWRYREGDWRIICSIQDQTVTVYVIDAGHRSNIYKRAPKRQRELTYKPISAPASKGKDFRISF